MNIRHTCNKTGQISPVVLHNWRKRWFLFTLDKNVFLRIISGNIVEIYVGTVQQKITFEKENSTFLEISDVKCSLKP